MANQELEKQRSSLWTDLLYELFHGRDSVFIAIDGFNQSGKTDFKLSIMEHAYYQGYFKHFGLNQQIENAPFEWDYIHDLETLFNRVDELKKPYLYFLDELGKTAPRGKPWNKLTLELIEKMEVKRKSKLSVMGASIGDVDRRIMSPNYLDVYFKKLSLTSVRMTHLRKRYSITLYDIPKTTIKFKEFTPAKFTLLKQSNDHFETPLMKRFRLYSEGVKQSDIWASRQQKKREIIKLYEMACNKVPHIDREDQV